MHGYYGRGSCCCCGPRGCCGQPRRMGDGDKVKHLKEAAEYLRQELKTIEEHIDKLGK